MILVSLCNLVKGQKNDIIQKYPDHYSLNKCWRLSKSKIYLQSPWAEIDDNSVNFRSFVWRDHFYFEFDVADDTPWVLSHHNDVEANAVGSDRVELFFGVDAELLVYYSLEMDRGGRLFDSRGESLHRSGEYRARIDVEWDISPVHLDISVRAKKKCYSLQGTLSLSWLRGNKLYQDDRMFLGVFAADYRAQDDVIWFTWVDPDLPSPKFHDPRVFKWVYIQ